MGGIQVSSVSHIVDVCTGKIIISEPYAWFTEKIMNGLCLIGIMLPSNKVFKLTISRV